MRPPLTYYGGKQKLAKLIISLIPEHKLYCEPFAGGAAVYFGKEPSRIEVLNDTNGELINFYQIVKNNFLALSKEVRSTLHSRNQHSKATVINAYPDLFSPVQRAWAIWVLAIQSYASKLNGNWGYDRGENKSAKQQHYKKLAFVQSLADRLEKTQIECADALQIIKTRDNEKSFFFLDPPYFNSHQGHYKGYSIANFTALLQVLTNIKGKFLLCSYPSPLLSRFIKEQGWNHRKIESNLSLSTHPAIKKKRKVEILTANYPI